MNRTLRRRLWVVGGASCLGILAPVWGPVLLRQLPVFAVEDMQVNGARFVSNEQVLKLAVLDSDASVWDDMQTVAEAIAAHPLILEARIRRTGIHRLDIDVIEVEPIALAATPVLVPVDASGRRVPIDPASHDVDLPVLLGGRMSDSDRVEPEAARRALVVLRQLSELDSEFARRISSLRPIGSEAVEFVLLPDSPVKLVILPLHDAVRAFLRVESAVGMPEIQGSIASADARYRGEVVIRLGGQG